MSTVNRFQADVAANRQVGVVTLRGSHRISIVLCASALCMSGCSGRSEPAAVSDSGAAPPPALPTAAEPPVSEVPAESGLSIKRGVARLAKDRMTFRSCGENAELWVVDQSDGAFTEAFGGEVQRGPVTVYVEAYGERAPVAEEIEAARVYGGSFVLEQVLYAGVQGEARGCAASAQDYIVAARGNEPFWAVEVGETAVLWRQPEAPREIDLGSPRMQSAEGTVRYSANAGGHVLELLIDARTCRDAMSGEFFAYAARAVLDGSEFTGCARVGR